MWEKMGMERLTVEEVLEIIDDSLCYGFEFKVENHTIWWREVQ